jgi:hypothetical protein
VHASNVSSTSQPAKQQTRLAASNTGGQSAKAAKAIDSELKAGKGGLASSNARPAEHATPVSVASGDHSAPGGQATNTSTATPSAADRSSTAWNEMFLKALGISAAILLQWGLIACLGGAALILVHLVYRYRDELLCIGCALPPPFRLPPPHLLVDSEDPIVDRAQRALCNISFQRSYSPGWSGSLKLPAGLEAGANLAVSLAQQQQSLPEVVQEFREFAATVAALHGKVIIGVDELDKLEFDEKAQAFVNEIKAYSFQSFRIALAICLAVADQSLLCISLAALSNGSWSSI